MGELTGWTHCFNCQDPMECGSWACCLYTSTQNRQASAMTRTKFSAQSCRVLHDAKEARVARKATHVVLLEADDGSWFELDAEDHGHAIVLAHNQVDLMDCRGASCWEVKPNGSLDVLPFYTYFPQE